MKVVHVNGVIVTLPYSPIPGIAIYFSGTFVVVQLDNGITIRFNGVYLVEVDADSSWMSSTCGLCGNYDLDMTDDFTKPDGVLTVTLGRNHDVYVHDNGLLSVNVPYLALPGITITYDGTNVVITTILGVTVRFDGMYRWEIDLSTSWADDTCGLCGNFNGDLSDDTTTKWDGTPALNIDDFGDSYAISTDCQLTDGGDPTLDCQDLTLAEGLCGIIWSALFEQCHDVIDPKIYFEACVFDVCGSQPDTSIVCQDVAAYAMSCSGVGISINWRTDAFCPLECPAGMTYSTCGCDKTCADPFTECDAPHCVEGCFCMDGLLRSGHECVPLERCGCWYKSQYFKPGEVYVDGNCDEYCVCQTNHLMLCETLNCDANAHCGVVEGQHHCICNDGFKGDGTTCIHRSHARCSGDGDVHYTSFDGKYYHFHGTCQYILVTDTCFGHNGTFLVTVDNIPWKHDTSVTKSVTIYYMGFEITILPMNVVHVNGVTVTLPYSPIPGITIYFSGIFVVVRLDNGITIRFNGVYLVEVDADSIWMSSTCGLCGNYDLDMTDDFTKPDGVLVTGTNEFGNSWVIGNMTECEPVTDTVDPCEEHPNIYHTVTLERNHDVYVHDNGLLSVNVPYLALPGITVTFDGTNVVINTILGVTVRFDGEYRWEIDLSTSWANDTCGLCGNFNGDLSDDTTTKWDGTPALNIDDFGDSYAIGTDCQLTIGVDPTLDCPDPTLAGDLCGVISLGLLFEKCHDVIDPKIYFEACVFDVCGSLPDTSIVCQDVAAYAMACSNVGININWRTDTLCPLKCPAGMTYSTCSCDKTCADPFTECDAPHCVEGCFCMDGLLRSGHECVPLERCGCWYKNQYFKPGEVYVDGNCDEYCVCQTNHLMHCETLNCDVNAHCGVVEGQRHCICNDGFTGDGITCHHENLFNITCANEVMGIYLEEQWILTALSLQTANANDFHLTDPTCTGTTSIAISGAVSYYFETAIDECDTESTEVEVDGMQRILYTNYVYSKRGTLMAKMQCCFDTEYTIAPIHIVANPCQVDVVLKGFGTFTFENALYTNDTFTTLFDPRAFPIEICDGVLIYFEISVVTTDPGLQLFVEHCVATESIDPSEGGEYDEEIIINGCPDDNILFEHTSPNPNWQKQYEWDAYNMVNDRPDNGENIDIYIHCSVVVCKVGEVGTRCSEGCIGSNKRSVYDPDSTSESTVISHGPLKKSSNCEI
ncbi:zonadhesin-like [Saccoglossus kowalevskii]